MMYFFMYTAKKKQQAANKLTAAMVHVFDWFFSRISTEIHQPDLNILQMLVSSLKCVRLESIHNVASPSFVLMLCYIL